MKLVTLSILLSLLLISCSQTQSNAPIHSDDAEQLMNDFFTALSTADSTLMTSITTKDFLMYEHDEIWNTDSLLSLMPLTEGRIWEIRDFSLTADGKIAHFNYFNQGVVPADRSWFESGLIIQTEHELKLKFMHSTKLYLNQ